MRTSNRQGFTLTEMLIVMVIFGVIMTSVTSLMLRTQRQFTEQRERIRVQESLRQTELVVTRVLRNARPDPMNANIGSIDPNPLNRPNWDNVRVRGDFNPADGDTDDLLEDVQLQTTNDTLYVRWRRTGPQQALAYPVRSLKFEYFAANGTPLTLKAQISAAVRAKVTITVPRLDGSGVISRRDAWVYLRNI